jgi:hypothetical protein
MIHYIKGVTGVEFYPSESAKTDLKVYASPFEKYKVWDFFFIVLFPYYRTKIAKERLWKYAYENMPNKYEIYTEEDLKEQEHLLVDFNGRLVTMPKVVVTLSDGTKETTYYGRQADAERDVAGLVKEYGLKQYYSLHNWHYPEDKKE